MQSLGAYGITFTSFTTEIHPSFYILIPILVLALLMALLTFFLARVSEVGAPNSACTSPGFFLWGMRAGIILRKAAET